MDSFEEKRVRKDERKGRDAYLGNVQDSTLTCRKASAGLEGRCSATSQRLLRRRKRGDTQTVLDQRPPFEIELPGIEEHQPNSF